MISIEKKVPERKLIGTIKNVDIELCISQVNDKKPVKAPKEEKISIHMVR